MKQILSIAFALALAGTMITGCENRSGSAGSGGTSASGSSSGSGSAGTSGSAGSSSSSEQKKPGGASAPSTPSGAGSAGSGTGSKKLGRNYVRRDRAPDVLISRSSAACASRRRPSRLP